MSDDGDHVNGKNLLWGIAIFAGIAAALAYPPLWALWLLVYLMVR